MIVIAESGSTKCEWLFLNNNGIEIASIRTQGFNPYFHHSDLVTKTLYENPEFHSIKDQVCRVYFYGAGCSSNKLNKIIERGLQKVFTKAKIEIFHDLLAAAYSVYNGKPMISCILGTGSNSCYFNGKILKESVPALGFVLGDEAGGCYFGKQFLADYFYKALPQEIQEDFTSEYGLTWEKAAREIYGNVHANVYLASFMPFIAQYKDHPHVENMIRAGMAKFIGIHILGFPEAYNCEVGFVGSIASVFQDILIEEMDKKELALGSIIQSPIKELVNYHMKNLNLESSNNQLENNN